MNGFKKNYNITFNHDDYYEENQFLEFLHAIITCTSDSYI